MQQLNPRSAIFNLCRAVRITGPLKIMALEESLNEIVQRHEALRTRFFTRAGRPMQRTAGFAPLALAVADLSKLSESRRHEKSQKLIRAITQRRFDLARGQLLRATLLRYSAQSHVLVFCTHHIVADAWSMGILTREFWQRYQARVSGTGRPLAPLPIQYRDYASWQRKSADSVDLDSVLAFWRNQLAGAAALELPADRPRPARQSFRGARHAVQLSAALTAALHNLSRRENATLFMTLLAAFQTLLHRYAGQDDIVVGAPMANRERRELEALIGFFINTLVLRADFSGAPAFTELLRRVRGVCLEAQAHQTLPFEKIVEALQPQREADRHSLFQAMFVLQNTPHATINPSELTLESMDVDNETSQFDLSLYLRERDGKLIGYFEYASELFDSCTVARMARHFNVLLKAIVANPSQSVAAFPLITDVERQELLNLSNHSSTAAPLEATIHSLFEAQVARTPNAIAVEFHGVQLTFEAVNQRANRVARYLLRRGVGPDKLVAICVERSNDMVIGLLAILKAGGAYVPVDPAYPQARKAYVLADAQVSLVLTQKKFAGQFRAPDLTAVVLDDDKPFAKLNEQNPVASTNSDNLAYVIYTSGSTGQPKGVAALHRGTVNRCAWTWRRYPFAAGEVCCAKTSLSFVDSVWEIFGPLLQGVRLVIPSDQAALEPRRLLRFLTAHQVSRIVVVPSLLTALLDSCASLRAELPKLLYWTSSGEALSSHLAERFKQSHPRALLLNLYGSSEVAADVTCFEYQRDFAGSSVPIGRPIDNTRIYILDKCLEPVPLGVIGEIYIAGAGVARGYWRRPELSKEKFLADPFNTGSRLFRSGDLARYLPDGNIEYRGRADGQIKLRGQRVELGEIEAVLRQHGEVVDCAVLPRQDPGGTAAGVASGPISLTCFVVMKTPPGPSASDLRAFLQRRLPLFMVPSAFVTLKHLPLLPNGKLDRRALMTMNIGPGPSTDWATGNEIEIQIAAIWRDLLNLERVGIHDNFFALGGHSLLGVQLVAALRQRFAKEITLRDLFEAPTVAAIAARLAGVSICDGAVSLTKVAPQTLRGKLPLSSSQQLFWRLDNLLSGAGFLNLPYGYQLTGPLDVTALRRSLQNIVDRHATLRSVFKEANNRLVQLVRRALQVRLPAVDLRALPDPEKQAALEQISSADADAVFDLEAGAPFRFKLIRMEDQEHVLLVTLHHIVGDQWSMRVLRQELVEFYDACVHGRPAALPDLPFQYVDFVRWQQRRLEDGGFTAHFAFWQRSLEGPLPALIFRSDRQQPKFASLRSDRKYFELDKAQFSVIQKLARQQKTTPFVLLLAALDVWLWKKTGCDDIRVATLVANRGLPHTEKLIGYFVNAVVLRGQLQARMKFVDLVRQLRTAALQGFAHQEAPIVELARHLLPEQAQSPGSLYQVMLNYRRAANQVDTAGGLTFAPWRPGQDRATAPQLALTPAAFNLEFREDFGKLTACVSYRVDLFEATFIARLVENFPNVMQELTERPERRLSSIQLF